jgi:hypothetical protein
LTKKCQLNSLASLVFQVYLYQLQANLSFQAWEMHLLLHLCLLVRKVLLLSLDSILTILLISQS